MRLLIALTFLALIESIPLHTVAQQVAAVAYTPRFTPCPTGASLVRSAGTIKQSLSSSESDYISARKSKVLSSTWPSYLQNVKKSADANGIQLPAYVTALLSIPRHQPTLGIATSGGGYRAAIFGAGVLNTLDGRNTTSAHAGTGGLLQAASYLSGLSGGSWLVGSLVQSDFPTFFDLVLGSSSSNSSGGWNAQLDLVTPSTNATIVTEFIVELVQEIAGKFLTGFPVTFTDVWARALSRHFVTGTTAANFFDTNLTHGAGVTFSSVTKLSTFTQHSQPFPIIVADSLKSNDTTSSPLANPIYEFNPFEFGSFDPQLASFTPTQFLGSPNNSLCVTGFDQLSYIQGISSDLFNGFNSSDGALAASQIGPIIQSLQGTFNQSSNIRLDASQLPNPFLGVAHKTFVSANETLLTLVDGGEDGEVIPIQPLLVKARKVDTIFAIDASADSQDNFSEGASLIATHQRASLFPKAYSFPSVPPTTDIFVSQNLTKRPTFFGCNTNRTDDSPLIIYLANGGAPLGQVAVTNTSTFQNAYPSSEIQGMFQQTFDIATQGIPGIQDGEVVKDKEWSVCLACAVVDRARRSVGVPRSGVCESCLKRYCWS